MTAVILLRFDLRGFRAGTRADLSRMSSTLLRASRERYSAILERLARRLPAFRVFARTCTAPPTATGPAGVETAEILKSGPERAAPPAPPVSPRGSARTDANTETRRFMAPASLHAMPPARYGGAALLFFGPVREHGGQILACVYPQLAVGGRQVLLDRLAGHVESLRDRGVRVSLGRHARDAPLVGRECVEAGDSRASRASARDP